MEAALCRIVAMNILISACLSKLKLARTSSRVAPSSSFVSASLIPAAALSLLGVLSLSTVPAAQAKELTIERSFSISYIDVPQTCELDTFKTTCTRLVNYYARRFEREMVSNLNYVYDATLNTKKKDSATSKVAANTGNSALANETVLENMLGSARHRQKSVQHVKMTIYSQPGDSMLTLFSIFKQKIVGMENKDTLLVETINFESETGKAIRFNQLFENPELAAMLCARAIEAKYGKNRSPLLPVVISATELSPSNFIIVPRGLRFFFAPGLVKTGTNVADSMLVHLEQLQAAKPVAKWWAQKDKREITAEDRAALAQSDLRDVINLDEDNASTQVEALASEHRAEQDAEAAARAIQSRAPTDESAATDSGRAVAGGNSTMIRNPR